MAENLVVIARIEGQKDKASFVRSAALKLIKPTRCEHGCLKYELHQDNEHPELLIFVEVWQNKEALESHRASAHLAEFGQAVDSSLVRLTVNEMTKIG